MTLLYDLDILERRERIKDGIFDFFKEGGRHLFAPTPTKQLLVLTQGEDFGSGLGSPGWGQGAAVSLQEARGRVRARWFAAVTTITHVIGKITWHLAEEGFLVCHAMLTLGHKERDEPLRAYLPSAVEAAPFPPPTEVATSQWVSASFPGTQRIALQAHRPLSDACYCRF